MANKTAPKRMPIHVECKYVRTVPSYSKRHGARKQIRKSSTRMQILALSVTDVESPANAFMYRPKSNISTLGPMKSA